MSEYNSQPFPGPSSSGSLLQSTLTQNHPTSPGAQHHGFNNYDGSQHYLIHDNTAPTHNYGPGSTSSSSNNWPEQFNNGYQRSAPPPQYDSCMEMGGHPPGQNITQFGTPTNHGVFYNNTFPIMTPTNLRDGVASSPPGRCPFNVNPEGTPPMAKITAQRKIVIGNGDKDQDDFSEKLISFARYNRNNRLIKEVLSDTIIPKTFVSTKRLRTLQQQVGLLEELYNNEQLDLAIEEERCSERKRKFLDSTAEFKEKYEALCRPVVGVKNYSKMFLKHYNQLKAAEASRKQWEQTLAWAQRTVEETTANISPPTDDSDIVANATA